MEMSWGVCKLEAADVTRAAEFLNLCWRAAYAGILDAGFLRRMTTEKRAELLGERLEAGVRGLLAVGAGGILGLVLFGPTHLRILADAGEISAIYVAPDLIGCGIGHRLMELAEAELVADGYLNVELDVFVGNERAIRFYRAHGYVKVGSKVDHIEDGVYDLDIMGKALIGASAS